MPQFANYLCLGGVEVVNGARTLAYLANVGHPFLRSVNVAGCVCGPGPDGGCTPGEVTRTFLPTGAAQTFTVPEGVTSIEVRLWGARGGLAGNLATGGSPLDRVGGTLAVTPGEVLQVNVGTPGLAPIAGTPGSVQATGGWNGGGDTVASSGGIASNAGGGGGASDIRQGGTGLADRVAVAAGTGGAGSDGDPDLNSGGAGGDGGPADSDGNNGTGGGDNGTKGLAPVSPSLGGVGGDCAVPFTDVTSGLSSKGEDGTLGQGGRGGSPNVLNGGGAGGGGGGGYQGGGGGGGGAPAEGAGAGGGGGGGGISWATPLAGDTITPDFMQTTSQVTLTYTVVCPPGSESGGGGEVFTTPADDDAPWYDPAAPESADVLGVWLEELSTPFPGKRSMTDGSAGGALGMPGMGPRELHMIGYVYTRSCKASAYAEQWLAAALTTMGACFGDCDAPDVALALPCDCEASVSSTADLRTVKRAGLVQFDPNVDPKFPCTLGFKFEATIKAEVPFLFHEPYTALDLDDIVNDTLTTDEACNICGGCPDHVPGCRCLGAEVPLPVVTPPVIEGGYCAPVKVRRRYAAVQAPYLWRDATTIITVADEAPEPVGLANLRILGWANPLQLPVGTSDEVATAEGYLRCVEPCLSVEVACLPPSGRLIIDGTTRRATMMCGAIPTSGYPYLSSNDGRKFRWPDLSCMGLLFAVEFDPVTTLDGLHVTIEVVPRDIR